MADEWVEVSGSNDETWDEKAPVTGVYRGFKSGVGPHGSNIYTIAREDGTTIGVWGSTVIDARMAHVEVGSMVKIESKGLKTSEKTKRTFKDYAVYVKPAPASAPKDDGEVDVESISF